MKLVLVATPAALALIGCGSQGTGGDNGYLYVGGVADAASTGFVTGDASGGQDFDAYIAQGNVAVKLIPLGCAGNCATVQAVGTGGYPPYMYEWENGSTSAVRQICPASDTRFSVRVTDSGQGGEVPILPQTVQASVTADVLACADGGATGGSVSMCDGGELVTPDINDNAESYFNDGGPLPAGQYTVSYVDGCIRYDPVIYWWAVNGGVTFEYWIAGETTADGIAVAPGVVSIGGDMDYADCESMSEGMSVTFDFDGGKLGVYNNDFKPSDNVPGTDGHNPTFRLDGVCP